jgi:hypothetical protein
MPDLREKLGVEGEWRWAEEPRSESERASPSSTPSTEDEELTTGRVFRMIPLDPSTLLLFVLACWPGIRITPWLGDAIACWAVQQRYEDISRRSQEVETPEMWKSCMFG